ncbi:MAG: hypothetical protein ABIJ39_10685 [Chloroflexota bacterium]
MISIPANAGIAARTTLDVQDDISVIVFPRAAREGTSTGFHRVRVSAIALHLSGGFHRFTFLRRCLLI